MEEVTVFSVMAFDRAGNGDAMEEEDGGGMDVVAATSAGEIVRMNGGDRVGSTVRFHAHAGAVYGLEALSGANGTPLVGSCGDDGAIRIWRAAMIADEPPPEEDARPEREMWLPVPESSGRGFRGPQPEVNAIVSAAGCIYAGGGDAECYAYDLETGRLTCTMTGHTGMVMAIDHCGRTGMLCSASDDGTVRLWDPRRPRALVQTVDVRSGKTLADAAGRKDRLSGSNGSSSAFSGCCRFDESGQWMVAGCGDGFVCSWSVSAQSSASMIRTSCAPNALLFEKGDIVVVRDPRPFASPFYSLRLYLQVWLLTQQLWIQMYNPCVR